MFCKLDIDHVLRKSAGTEGEYQMQPPEELRTLTQLKERAENGAEPNELYAVASELAVLIGQVSACTRKHAQFMQYNTQARARIHSRS